MNKSEALRKLKQAQRLAGIDVGSNSLRLIVADVLGSGCYRVIDEERQPTRLANELSKTGRIHPDAIEESLQALRRFRQIASGFGVDQIRAIATCAVREAENGLEFCRRAQTEAGIHLEVISSREEAELAFLSVQRAFDVADRKVAVVDIGGGSTEIVLAAADRIRKIYATPLGAVRLTEQIPTHQQLTDTGFDCLVRKIDRTLKRKVKKPPFVPEILFGTGGTFTTLAAMVMAAKGQAGEPMWGYRVLRADLRNLLSRLRKMNLKERRAVPGLNAQRADIIVAGLCVIDRVMKRLGVSAVQVHSRGIRDGLLLTMIDGVPQGEGGPYEREHAVREFAARCGVDLEHASQVKRTARLLFDELAGPYGLDPSDRELLEAAAILQNVGSLISFEGHHKHSYHLVFNSQIPGFERHELELIANVVRYHRGAKPKQKHRQFQRLTKTDQRRALRLAAILRLANALNRSRRNQIESVSVAASTSRTEIEVYARGDSDVDIWAARCRAEFFEKAFGTDLSLLPRAM